MNRATPPHPFGHGRPLSADEVAVFSAIVADLAHDSPRAGRRTSSPTSYDRLQRVYAWLRKDESRPPEAP